MTTDNSVSLDDPRVIRASRDYLADLEAGRQPDRQVYYQRDPELRGLLAEVFDGIEIAQTMQPKPMLSNETLAEPLGDFRIVRELGRGGMGIVYEAVQLSLGRRVALKVLPFSAALDVRQRQRFQIEAKAAALLHHSNIVPIYAVGCERGLHFYAMQLIDGGTLADLIAEKRRAVRESKSPQAGISTVGDESQPTRPSSASHKQVPSQRPARSRLRETIELMAKVADALDYAHQAGTIHRDIKPANLMLDPAGNVWITDFGLAHIAADVSLTMTGDILGTMRYMSPEQAGGQRAVLDGRTDIYSLGATMYELLTLQPLFASNNRQTLLNAILNDEPKPLRKWDRSISEEVETIVLKCLSKNAFERYATAAHLAADLRRFLDERPILARRPTLLESMRKWLRRHPSYAIAAAVVMIGGVIGMAITTAIVAQEQQRTQVALHAEVERAREAESRFVLAQRAADEMIQIAQNELSETPFQDGAQKRLLQGALKYYQEFVTLKATSPPEQERLKQTRTRIEEILEDLTALDTGRQYFLIREPDVLDDLEATTEQRERLAEFDQNSFSRHDWGGGPPHLRSPEQKQNLIQLARDANTVIRSILTVPQQARLRQIAFQSEGLKVIFEPEIASQIQLTTLQKQQIREIEHRCLFGDGPPHGPSRRGKHQRHEDRDDHDDRDEKMRTAIRETMTVLTPAQQAIWDKLRGKPFDGALHGPPMVGMPHFPLHKP